MRYKDLLFKTVLFRKFLPFLFDHNAFIYLFFHKCCFTRSFSLYIFQLCTIAVFFPFTSLDFISASNIKLIFIFCFANKKGWLAFLKSTIRQTLFLWGYSAGHDSSLKAITRFHPTAPRCLWKGQSYTLCPFDISSFIWFSISILTVQQVWVAHSEVSVWLQSIGTFGLNRSGSLPQGNRD